MTKVVDVSNSKDFHVVKPWIRPGMETTIPSRWAFGRGEGLVPNGSYPGSQGLSSGDFLFFFFSFFFVFFSRSYFECCCEADTKGKGSIAGGSN